VVGFSWAGGTRILVHIADAPAHGADYNDCRKDNHPGASVELYNIVKVLSRRVNYYFGRIKKITDKMTTRFQQIYKEDTHSKIFAVCQLDNPNTDFIPTLVNSITRSMIDSAAARVGQTDIEEIISKAMTLGLI